MTEIFDNWPEQINQPLWLTIGNFDGMHLGHQALLVSLREYAQSGQAKSALITFWPHPRVFLQQITSPFYLTTKAEKTALLEKSSVDYAISLPFTYELAGLSPQDFFAELTKHLHIQGMLVGEDFTLGRNRVGTSEVIRDLCALHGIRLEIINPFCLDGLAVSSGRVRDALDGGQVQETLRLLGRPYSVTGNVVEGKHLGSKLGFPTANLVVDAQKILPKFGVYATIVRFNGECHMGVTSVGVRPTFETTNKPNVETLLLDFDGNIYHESLKVEFIHHLRGEIKFGNVQDLIAQIELDKVQARRMLAHESFSESLPA
ncbi:MAG: bifunctional riboflavin kinase/FAD synthetase [Anaerolineaceae bacterium]